MPHIAVRATFGYARHHRQDRLLAIECLDLALLIDAEDEGSVWRGKVKADDIAYLVDEQRVVRQLERLATVRLQAERRPHPADRSVGKASFCRHRADRPVRRVGRRRAQRPFDHPSNLIVVDSSGSAGRASSSRPSQRSFKNRRRHLPTVCSWRPSSAAPSLLSPRHPHISE